MPTSGLMNGQSTSRAGTGVTPASGYAKLIFHSGSESLAIGIERINAIVLGGGIDDVVHAFARDLDSRQIERLRVDGPVHRKRTSLPNCFTLTLAGVRMLSLRFAPVRALSYCEVVS